MKTITGELGWHHHQDLEFFKLNKQDDPIRDIVKIKLYNQQLCYQQHLRLRFVDWAQFSSWIFSQDSPVSADFFCQKC